MPERTERPNLVLVTADQWRGDCLTCANSAHPAMTPHIDQIAAEGVRYTQAYTDCPVCMPQRVTLLTGQVASRFGVTGNFRERSPIDSATSLPGRLTRDAGYQTKAVGKMHFAPSRARFGFEHISLHPNDYVNWLEEHGYGGFYRGHGLGGNEVYPAVSALPERYTHTHWIVDQAIAFLGQRDPDCPFLLWIVFEAPHSPFDPPEPYDRFYDNITIPAPACGDWCSEDNMPPLLKVRRATFKYENLTAEMIAEARRRYYGQITHIDYQLGRFFGELKTRGLYNDTAIAFTSDHGEHLGDHRVFAKTTYLQASARVPLVLRVPAWTPSAGPAQVFDAPALTADLFPTFLELAGLAPDTEQDGVSMLPALQSGAAPARRVHGECGGTAFCTDGKYKYVYYVDGGIEQLFDVVNDPDDLHDLSHDTGCDDIKQRLGQSLVEYLAAFDRPMVEDGRLAVRESKFDEQQCRGRNPCAWRGPMRHNQGYDGYTG